VGGRQIDGKHGGKARGTGAAAVTGPGLGAADRRVSGIKAPTCI